MPGELKGSFSDRQRTLLLEGARQGRAVRLGLSLAEADAAVELSAARADFMHARELATLSTFRSLQREHNFALGRWAAKQAVAAVTPGFEPNQIEIVSGVFGQPYVGGIPNPPALSLTHTDRGAVALAIEPDHILGVDLENIALRHEDAFRRALTTGERDLTTKLSAEPVAARSALIWTLKEALSKALRCGFTTSFAVLELESLEPHADGGFRALFRNFAQYHGRAWLFGSSAFAVVLPKHTALALTTPAHQALAHFCAG